MGEKFCLKWNDFQSTVSSSFKTLRQEEDFFDVTLVSDDEVQMSAHKLILSACSSFFKSILKKNPHPNPLIYLSGVDSTSLGYILDYMYNGEVQIFQQNLDPFLEMAQKLSISGLISNTMGNSNDDKMDYYPPPENEVGKIESEDPPVVAPKRHYRKTTETIQAVAVQGENFDVKDAVNNLIIWENEAYVCKTCGKGDKRLHNMKKHVEIHIEGLTYECQLCAKTFRSKNSYNFHKYRNHQSSKSQC